MELVATTLFYLFYFFFCIKSFKTEQCLIIFHFPCRQIERYENNIYKSLFNYNCNLLQCFKRPYNMSNIFITVSTFPPTLLYCNIKVLLRIIQPTTLQFAETCCEKQLGLQLGNFMLS